MGKIDEIEIGDRYECVGIPFNGYTVNKVYNIVDVGLYIWVKNDLSNYNAFINDSSFNKYFMLIKNNLK